MKHLRLLLPIFILFCVNVFASEPLLADQAFQFSATAKDYQTILVNFKIAPNYFLYQQHFEFHVIKPNTISLGAPIYPSNTEKLKTALGTFDVYSSSLTIPIPIINANVNNLVLQVGYQGCSKAGYCYPPTTKVVSINLAGNYFQPARELKMDVAPQAKTISRDALENLFHADSFFLLITTFLGIGILLSFTPCVLPMIPILYSMIVGKEKMSHAHAFFISLFYVLGMSITYAVAGIVFGVVGESMQVIFQKPWIIAVFSALFVLMSLSLFGLFNLQLPESLRAKIANISQHQKRGTYFGAFFMGILSTLILSPCVTPPLVAALGFISHTGDAALGGAALFAMGIGMGAPLLLIGLMGPKILPKSGEWMNTVKNLMGIVLLAVAIFMLQRILPGMIIMILWAGLSIGFALYLGALSSAKSFSALIKKIIGLLFFVYGILLMVDAYHGNTNCNVSALHFQTVHTVSDINHALKQAEKNNQIVMLDFSADWCVACKELESITFEDHIIKAKLSQFVLLRADISKNSAENQILMQQYNVIAPPTILFFKDEKEIPNSRVIGYQPPEQFLMP